jgi:GH43 family beta-xylosidase
MRCLARAFGVIAPLLASSCALGDTLAWWRFEDQAIDAKLAAGLGSRDEPFVTTKSTIGPDLLRTFNTRADRNPPDTSGTFKQPADLPSNVAGQKNARCVRFVGKQDFYTTDANGAQPSIDAAKLERFTVEGLFRLDVTSGQIGDRYQCIVGKDGRPVERLPFQPFVVVVAGNDDEFMSRDCLAVNLLDRSGKYRTAASRVPLRREQWYGFAAVSDGTSLKLFLNRFDGKGYQLEGETAIDGGLVESTGTWTVGRGMFESNPNSWLQGLADEIRISDEALAPNQWLTSAVKSLPRPPIVAEPNVERPTLCVRDLADPAALLHDGVYYLYGTGDSRGFDVWSSRDLKTWEKSVRAIEAGEGVWGDGAFWAPAIVERNGKFYLFYSASGILPVDGGRRSVRICVAVADSPTGPFREVVARLPLIGRAVIDPDVFIDSDGTPYLYFVADLNDISRTGEIYVVKLSDDLLSPVGEPVACISASQPWEGTVWNEGPTVAKVGETYVLMYSGNFWGSHDYAVGFATAPTPMGPWDKYDENPILRRYAGLFGTGHNSIVRDPKGDWLTFFHAHRGERDASRDTYVAKLKMKLAENGRVEIKVVPR